MPARYRDIFAMAKCDLVEHLRNTVSWINGINNLACFPTSTRATQRHNPAVPVRPVRTLGNGCLGTGRVQSQYASVQLVDGANINAMATIGSIRGTADNVQTQIANLEQDRHFSGDSKSQQRSLRPEQDQCGGRFDSPHRPGLEQTPRASLLEQKPSLQS